MLTPTEVHLLAGMLVLASAESGEDVELGSTLMDGASGTLRDVDITVRCAINGVPHVLAGIEVKAHGRPLDIEDVEQLVIKLSDVAVPTGRRAIVSASGYSAAATAKARAHRVSLYSLIPWRDELAQHDTPFRGHRPPLLVEHYWSDGPHVHVEIEGAETTAVDGKEIEVLIEERNGTMSRRPLEVLIKNCVKAAEEIIDPQFDRMLGPGQDSRQVAQQVNLQNRVVILAGDREVPVQWVGVAGVRTQEAVDGKESLRFLVDAETLVPVVSCSVRVLRGGELCLIAMDHRTRRIVIQSVSAEIRGRRKIYRMPMTRSDAPLQ